jgi:hypothetical protein
MGPYLRVLDKKWSAENSSVTLQLYRMSTKWFLAKAMLKKLWVSLYGKCAFFLPKLSLLPANPSQSLCYLPGLSLLPFDF